MDIGLKIKNLRMQQKRTLQDVADACGYTKSLLSKIENGKVMPPISTLVEIGKALGVKVSALVEDDEKQDCVFISSTDISESNQVKTDKGYNFFVIASEFANKKMQPFLFTAKKGNVKEHHLSHPGEEYIYMLEGEMKFKVGKVEYLLRPGDSLYFNSIEYHGVTPVSQEIKYIDIFTE